ncbi:hypothetical protein ASZ90_008077 [hydrocarbon metagenome]|uniref:Uncharacterized protein n=1 Tax=hydrocarbon metagenome TaxID=938273 RepID=A0A0W8FMV3_9ZZZZ
MNQEIPEQGILHPQFYKNYRSAHICMLTYELTSVKMICGCKKGIVPNPDSSGFVFSLARY